MARHALAYSWVTTDARAIAGCTSGRIHYSQQESELISLQEFSGMFRTRGADLPALLLGVAGGDARHPGCLSLHQLLEGCE